MRRFKNVTKTGLAISLGILLTGLSFSSAHAKTDLVSLSNELEIMTNIMRTSLGQSNRETAFKIRGLEVKYLANQGVLFVITTSQTGGHFSFKFNNDREFIVSPTIAPVPPAPGHGESFVFEFNNEEWSEAVEEVVEEAREAIEEARDQLRDIRHQERDYSWEQRNYERQLRDLEFELRNADNERRKEIEKDKAQIKKEIDIKKSKQEELSKYARELEKEQKAKATKRLAAKKKQHVAFLTKFESNFSDTLCKYGNGIKALPGNENVSFVLSRFGSPEKNHKQDKIYVFSNKDIQACVKDKLSAKQLLAKAESYSF